ncbi:hypothetical protein PSDVSF_17640 [Pseudodesulfovibrio sediminis]|uniref:Uncharacterized protein n=1 Tax=Pseudodesulfovibrio sediminis TaxID=2810563 RepID=A0ABM7P6R1_9BACT|nr:hypothetical protein PSDVSF_17640 [Pseudodesulfovibrio sediminis]
MRGLEDEHEAVRFVVTREYPAGVVFNFDSVSALDDGQVHVQVLCRSSCEAAQLVPEEIGRRDGRGDERHAYRRFRARIGWQTGQDACGKEYCSKNGVHTFIMSM